MDDRGKLEWFPGMQVSQENDKKKENDSNPSS